MDKNNAPSPETIKWILFLWPTFCMWISKRFCPRSKCIVSSNSAMASSCYERKYYLPLKKYIKSYFPLTMSTMHLS